VVGLPEKKKLHVYTYIYILDMFLVQAKGKSLKLRHLLGKKNLPNKTQQPRTPKLGRFTRPVVKVAHPHSSEKMWTH
jgi:hypothetical protein